MSERVFKVRYNTQADTIMDVYDVPASELGLFVRPIGEHMLIQDDEGDFHDVDVVNVESCIPMGQPVSMVVTVKHRERPMFGCEDAARRFGING